MSISEAAEAGLDQWMTDRRAAWVRFQVSLGDVGFMVCVMYQHSVPRLVFRWSCARDGFIPFVRQHQTRIHVDYDSAVVEQFVLYQITNRKMSLC